MKTFLRVVVVALLSPSMLIGFLYCFFGGGFIAGMSLCEDLVDKLDERVRK